MDSSATAASAPGGGQRRLRGGGLQLRAPAYVDRGGRRLDQVLVRLGGPTGAQQGLTEPLAECGVARTLDEGPLQAVGGHGPVAGGQGEPGGLGEQVGGVGQRADGGAEQVAGELHGGGLPRPQLVDGAGVHAGDGEGARARTRWPRG